MGAFLGSLLLKSCAGAQHSRHGAGLRCRAGFGSQQRISSLQTQVWQGMGKGQPAVVSFGTGCCSGEPRDSKSTAPFRTPLAFMAKCAGVSLAC